VTVLAAAEATAVAVAKRMVRGKRLEQLISEESPQAPRQRLEVAPHGNFAVGVLLLLLRRRRRRLLLLLLRHLLLQRRASTGFRT
jgi:hypothetical protein